MSFALFSVSFQPVFAAGEGFVRATRLDGRPVKLEVKKEGDERHVVLSKFCKQMGCKVLYQWDRYRSLIKNPLEKKSAGAIISPITHVAIIDGRLLEFESDIRSDSKLGYIIPLELAGMLARNLKLGSIENDGLPKREPLPVVDLSDPKPLPPIKPVDDKELRKVRTIVIDPGHGGNDIGTKHGSLAEKDIALIYAVKIRDELKKDFPDMNVILTRDNDTYVSLQDRAELANKAGADFFLSLHVNHAPNAVSHGAETFILNPNATDDDARKTALLENESWIKSIKNENTKSGSDIMKILADMEQTKYIQNSALAAAYIQQELAALDTSHGLKNRGVKQAMFFVLSQVAMPSVLVEIGFLSNTGDRDRIMNAKFSDQFSQKVAAAIKRYRIESSKN